MKHQPASANRRSFLGALLAAPLVLVAPSLRADQPGWESSREYFAAVVGDTVRFRRDHADLSQEAMAILDRQISWLLQNPGYSIVLQGHGDDKRSREYSLALGERRAAAVKQYMAMRGLPATRIVVLSYGRERPLDTAPNPAARAKNRRVETRLEPAP